MIQTRGARQAHRPRRRVPDGRRREPDLRHGRLPGAGDRPDRPDGRLRPVHRRPHAGRAVHRLRRLPEHVYRYTLPAARDVPLYARFDSLYRFLERATAADPDDRFQTAEEMAGQLVGVLREIVAASTGSPAPGASTSSRRPAAARSSAADWRTLPAPLVDPDDPQAGVILALGAAGPGRVIRQARRRTRATSVEIDLWLARALHRARPARRGRRRPRRRRRRPTRGSGGRRGTAASPRSPPATAPTRPTRPSHGCTGTLPGELAPKLALGRGRRVGGDHAAAAAWYEIVVAHRPGVHVGRVRPRPVPPALGRPGRRHRRVRPRARHLERPRRRPGRRGPAPARRRRRRRDAPTSSRAAADRRAGPARSRAAGAPDRRSVLEAALRARPRRRRVRRRRDRARVAAFDGARAPARARGRRTARWPATPPRRRADRARRPRQPRAPEDAGVNAELDPALPGVRRRRRWPTTSSASRAGRRSVHARDDRAHHVELDPARRRGVRSRPRPRAQRGRLVRRRRRRAASVAVVCDGVSASAAPQVASRSPPTPIGQRLVAARDGDGDGDRATPLVRALAAGDDAVLAVPWMPTRRPRGAVVHRRGRARGTARVSPSAGPATAGPTGSATTATLLTLDHSWAQEQVVGRGDERARRRGGPAGPRDHPLARRRRPRPASRRS